MSNKTRASIELAISCFKQDLTSDDSWITKSYARYEIERLESLLLTYPTFKG